MSNKPFFTVVIPTYNRSTLLCKAINSVLGQTYQDWNLVIADDCSTDDTEEIIRPYLSDTITFFKNKKNIGNAGARNLGVKHANGSYICFLDSDDQYHPNFLQKMHDLIKENNNPGFLWSDVNRIDSNGELEDHTIPASWEPRNAKDPYLFFLGGLFFGTGYGFTVRSDCFETTGYFDEQFRTAVDTDFILRIVQDFNFEYTKEILVDTYDHDGDRVRKNSREKLKSYKILLEKHKSIIHQYPKLKQTWYYKLMWLSYHNGFKYEARKYLAKAVGAGKYKSFLTAGIFELLSKNKAIGMHKKISEAL